MQMPTYKEGSLVFIKAILLNLAVQMLFSIIVTAIVVGTSGNSTEIPTIYSIIAMIGIQGGFFVAVYSSVKMRGVGVAYLKEEKVTPLGVILAVVVAVTLIACFSLIAEWFAIFLHSIGYKHSGLELNGALEWVLAVIAVVILAPIMEETIFRSMLLGGLRTKFKPCISVLLSGLCFALMHMSAEQTVYQFILGLTCAIIVLSSGSYVYSIITHSVSNLIALILPLIPLPKSSFGNVSVLLDNPALSAIITVALALVGCAVIGLIAWLYSKKRGATTYAPAEKEEEGWFSANAMLIASIVICLVMWISNAVVALS